MYGTPRFVTVFTTARQLSLSCARLNHSVSSHPISCKIRFNITLLSRYIFFLPSCLCPSDFPSTFLLVCSTSSHVLCYMPISSSCTLSPDYCCVRSTNHKAPHYTTPLFYFLSLKPKCLIQRHILVHPQSVFFS